ncbi:ABC transporter substrate-binding protein [Govanella unica]|uniref:ABC transporter substrate-binding protein n=1 Tax=Govanella unica TaxID=2975056 RepID=A0A9X3Z766_9PROT|nr:ABC transporter substrate-binding protein [Govania unica]MDA5193920.1 ABC transporter substrate-binding protein [Govania unica]
MRGFVAASRAISFVTGGRGVVLALTAFLCAGTCAAAPQRVISLDFCADQFLLALADRSQIAAVSRDVGNERSYLAAAAKGLPQSGDSIEDIVVEHPDLVLRVWGGGYRVDEMLGRFRVPVVTIPFTQDLAGLRQSLRDVGHALGQEARADDLIVDMDRRLAAVETKWRHLRPEDRPRAVYITPGGVLAGAGTLMDAMMQAAGLRNLTAEAGYRGWQSVDLERLLLTDPDVIVLGFQDLVANRAERWQPGRHDALKQFIAARPNVEIPSRVIACSAWYFVDGVEAIFDRLVAPRLQPERPRP